ncbi:MAG TPA: hypothetical protein VLL54_18010 [Pyrinomonadaceae bacterium]|nr:hypothetical protein [Pyrinomonadaceae bacterium]
MRTKPKSWSVLAVLTLLVFCAFPVCGQLGDKEKAEQEQKQKQELERKTFVLIDDIATSALSLKLPENRIYVLTATADLLWEHDESHAKNLFWDALNVINLINNSSSINGDKDGKKLTNKERQQQLQQYYSVYSLRLGLLQRVARRDPQLALEMLRSSRQVPMDQLPGGLSPPDDRELEQQIAAEVAARDPERALELARESLNKGLSYQIFQLLFRLNQRDAKAGSAFAGDIIEKIRGRNLSTDPYAAQLAVSLLGISRTRDEGPEKNANRGPLLSLKLEPEQKRVLVDLITNAALAGSANANVLYNIDDVMPEIEQFAPERIALLKRKLAAFNQTLNSQQKSSLEYRSTVQNGSPEDMLKLANRVDDENRGWIQEQAIATAVANKRTDSLRSFINAEVSDEGRRKELLDQLDAGELEYAVYKSDVTEMRKLLPRIRRREVRAQAMAEIAIKLERKGEHEEALKLLDEAQTMIKNDLTSESQTNALLALTAAYALVEPSRAFTIVERTIDEANDEIAKALFWDKIVSSGAVKKGELRLAQSGMVPIDFALFKFGDAVSILARADFDRTRAAADRFQRYELRLMARLLLVQALLRTRNSPSLVPGSTTEGP